MTCPALCMEQKQRQSCTSRRAERLGSQKGPICTPVVNQVPFPVLLKLKLLLDSPPQGTKGLCVSSGVCQHGNTPCPARSSTHLHGAQRTSAVLCPPPRAGCCTAVGQAGTAEAWPARVAGQDREMQVLQSSGGWPLLWLFIIIIINL